MNVHNIGLSDVEFTKLSSFIYANYGIKLPITKKVLLQSRLQNRLRETNLSSFKEYCDYVLSHKDEGTEIIHMIDVVSTNKTDFFREPAHFDFLQSTILPECVNENPNKEIKIWSAACSSGEEIYTLAMLLNEFSDTKNKINYSLLGTDISTRVLEKAAMAIYSEDKITPILLNLRKKYLLRNKNPEKKDVRIVPELRKKVRFQRLNLMDNKYNVPTDFDVIFCRNVLIYFDKATQEKVINKLCNHIKPHGYLILGHSESITGIIAPLKQVKPTIYVKTITK